MFPDNRCQERPPRRRSPGLGCPDRCQEIIDFELELAGLARQRLRRRQHLARSRAGIGGSLMHVGDGAADLRCAAGSHLHIAGDLAGCHALLFHGRGNHP